MRDNRGNIGSQWLPYTILTATSFLVPADQRAQWAKEWRSELWYIPQRGATVFCLGAFRDALWLRRNLAEAECLSPVKGIRGLLQFPLTCLAFMATFAMLSILIAACLTALPQQPSLLLRPGNLSGSCAAALLFSCLLLPGTLAVWRSLTIGYPMPWPIRLRWGIFFALKIALVQPMMLSGLIVQALMGPLGGLAGLGFNAAFILTLRWVITDQQQRCPVCLRLLIASVRLGAPSSTFLEWYGAESACPQGHGLLYSLGHSSSYSRKQQWLRLDDSWSSLFPAAFRG